MVLVVKSLFLDYLNSELHRSSLGTPSFHGEFRLSPSIHSLDKRTGSGTGSERLDWGSVYMDGLRLG